jgi:hypothetical protein
MVMEPFQPYFWLGALSVKRPIPSIELSTLGKSLNCGMYHSKLKANSHFASANATLKLILAWARVSTAAFPSTNIKQLPLGQLLARAYASTEVDHVGKNLNCGISHSKLKATTLGRFLARAYAIIEANFVCASVSTAACPSAS